MGKKDHPPIKKALHSTHKKYQDLFNSLNDAATLFEMRSNGLPGRYLEVNDTLCRWLGYTREELLKLSPLDISEKEDETVNSEVAGTFAKKGKSVIERMLLAKNGRKIPVEVNFHLITYEGKKVVLSISRDISDRKAAEAALRESEEKFFKVFHANPLPMSISSLPDGKYVDVNEKFERVSGWSAKEAKGRTTAELNMWVHPEDFSMLVELLTKENSARGVELELRAKSGDIFTFLWSAEVVVLGGRRCIITSAYDITGRKRMEDALRESEEKFRTVIEQNSEGVVLVDEKGKIMEWNKELERISGVPRAEAIGKDYWELQFQSTTKERKTPEAYARMKSLLRSALTDFSSLRTDIDAVLSRPDGSMVSIHQSVFPVKTRSGYLLGSVIRDITNQKQAQAALRESEERFRGLVQSMNDIIYTLDKDQRHTGVYGKWLAQDGLTPEFFLGKTASDIFGKENAPVHEKANARALAGEYVVYEWSSITDGKHRYFQTSLSPLHDADGAITGLVGIGRDITEKKSAEVALRESEQRFKTLIENAYEGVSVINRDYSVKYESPGLDRILGYSPKERFGTGAFDYIHPDDIQQVQEALGRALARPDEIVRMTLRIKHKDGAWRWIESIGKNLLDDAAIGGIVINYRDITERKQAEEAQQKLEQQIQQVEKLESIGILAGGIAHDFNNLLTGIFGYIDVARLYNSSGESDKVTLNLSKALDVFNRARALTQQLLTFSKGGSPVKKTLSLSPLLTSTANFVLSGSNVSARFSFSNDLWPCEVDENQLGQVIDNIIINARQAMPTGGSIVVTAENIPEGQPVPAPLVPGNYVRISIRDFGIGIAKEHLPHIFDPFFTTKQEGSGLGLATAYSIVRKHEGIIEVESELGIGSTFHIYLPALPSAAAESLSTGIKKHRGQGVVLVMDDEEFVRDVAMELVKTMGYTVESAKNGVEAIAKFKKAFSSEAPYAFVILDLTIAGGMGGKETVQELLKFNPSVAAIASSGYSHDPVMTDPKAFGFKDKIRKPFTKEELGEVLERVVASNK